MRSNYQQAPLRMIFDVKKEDQRRKARHVVGVHVVDASYLESYSSAVQSMSARMILTIVESCDLKVMGGDVWSAFPRAPSLEKVCAFTLEEFGEQKGCVAEII